MSNDTARAAPPVARYLAERFPPTQAAAALSILVCSFLLYGAVADDHAPAAAWVGGAVTVAALLLVHRLADDITDAADDPTPAFTARGMLIGALALVAVTALANALVHWTLGVFVLAVAAWSAAGNLADRRFGGALGVWLLCDIAVALILLYPYLLWRQATDASVDGVVVAGLVAGLWTGYLFWVLSRKAGKPEWLAPGVRAATLRVWLSAMLVCSAVAAVLAGASRALPLSYPTLGVVVALVLAVLMLRWWPDESGTPRAGRSRAWAGLTLLLTTQLNAIVAAIVLHTGS